MITQIKKMENQNKNVSRRKFLETAAIAGTIGTIGLGSALVSCNRKKTPEELGLPPLLSRAPDGRKLKAGLVGAGHRGTGAALNFISAGRDLEVVALADVFPDKIDECRARFKKYDLDIPEENCFTGFDGYKKLLETDIDVVLLATPPKFRPEHFAAAIKEKKHVFMQESAPFVIE